jgi:hypothetical protein
VLMLVRFTLMVAINPPTFTTCAVKDTVLNSRKHCLSSLTS